MGAFNLANLSALRNLQPNRFPNDPTGRVPMLPQVGPMVPPQPSGGPVPFAPQVGPDMRPQPAPGPLPVLPGQPMQGSGPQWPQPVGGPAPGAPGFGGGPQMNGNLNNLLALRQMMMQGRPAMQSTY